MKTQRFVQVSGIITDESYRPVQGVAIVSKKLTEELSVKEQVSILLPAFREIQFFSELWDTRDIIQ